MTLRTKRAATLALLILPALATFAAAQPATDSDWHSNANSSGRYSMSPVDGGVMRLDKETGVVAICARVGNELACRAVEDKTNVAPADELSALRAENKQLKLRIKEMMDALENGETIPPMHMPYGYGPHGGPAPGGKFELPSDAEVDQALDYLSRVYKKIRDHVKDLDKPSSPPGEAAAPSPPPIGPGSPPPTAPPKGAP